MVFSISSRGVVARESLEVATDPTIAEARNAKARLPKSAKSEIRNEIPREENTTLVLNRNIREKHWRSLAKTMSWRVAATITTLSISYAITGSLKLAGLIGGIEFFSKMFLYYIHERLWNRVQVGIEAEHPPPDYQI